MEQELSAIVATFFCNFNSSRARQPSLTLQKRGWTEVWGVDTDTPPNETKPDETSSPTVELTQFDISYQEQLFLRIANIPHVVKNSSYMVNEATGSLPFLTDLTCSEKPTLVGRVQPKFNSKSACENGRYGSDIITYLDKEYNINLDDKHLTTPHLKTQSVLFKSLILDTVEPILDFIYHSQTDCQEANWIKARTSCLDPNNQQTRKKGKVVDNLFVHPFARFQYWAARQVAIRDSNHVKIRGRKITNEKDALEMVREAYVSIHAALEGRENLLGTDGLTHVDILLFAHIARALSISNLFILFHEEGCKNVLNYYRRVYAMYFESEDIAAKGTGQTDENNAVNKKNAHYLPLSFLDEASKASKNINFDAVMSAVVAKRSQMSGKTLHRIRFGGSVFPSEEEEHFYGYLSSHRKRKSEEEKESGPGMMSRVEKMKKEGEHYDTLWIGFVVAGIGMAMVVSNKAGR